MGSSSPASINAPSGIVQADVLIVGLMYEKGTAETITAPAGWNLIRRTDNATDIGLATYYKVAQSTEPAAYNFTIANGSHWSMGITRIGNINHFSPVNASSGNTGNSGNPNAASVNTTGPNRLILCFYTNAQAANFTAAPSVSEVYDAPNTAQGKPSNMMAYFTVAAAAASGNKTSSASISDKWAAQQVALSPATPLPISLIDFSVYHCNDTRVCLNWKTASEKNNHYFEIQQSSDGQNWMPIGKMVGSGNSQETKTYQFEYNTKLQHTSYFRLKQVDFDGSFVYSVVRVIGPLNQAAPDFEIFPNPTQRFILLNTNEEDGLTIKCYNAIGQDLTSLIKVNKKSSTFFELDVSEFPNGSYLIKVNNHTKRWIKIN